MLFFRLTPGRCVNAGNVIQTILLPCYLSLLIAPLAGLVKQFPWFTEFGVAGTGMTPAPDSAGVGVIAAAGARRGRRAQSGAARCAGRAQDKWNE